MYRYRRGAVSYLYVANILMVLTLMAADKEVPNTNLASLGNIAEMTCLFNSDDSWLILIWKSMGITLLSHSWQESATKIDGRFTSIIGSNGKTCRLLITNASFEDVGKYDCFKSYYVSGKPEKCSWNLDIQDPASVRWKPHDALSNYVIAERNGNVNVTCLSDGYPSPDIGIQSLRTNNNAIWQNLSFAGTILETDGGLKTWLYQVNIASNQSVTLRCAIFNCHMPCKHGDEFLVKQHDMVMSTNEIVFTINKIYDFQNIRKVLGRE
ncbi:hypothetical protein BSL78_11435 [Apostichopus japonicus]|uniref:Ig-like domain-containing protein n=1 Tax=Stichopus japonicus TaxID=307972 RepID=A0A2G8KUI3_STIJA|nr:hypothetical protein BSL78_11435 [Apostichopus japonicus]